MADDLTRPYIGYRSAGRRPERNQDRRASADAPLAALRGMISGVAGAPGDIESLVRMLPGLSEHTVLPTSEDIERRLPLRGVSETPVGRAATGAGQIGGGFYTGPGSPLRAIAALPSAVSRAGRDFVMASGQPAVNVVKPKGGNWLAGSIEREIAPMRVRERTPGVNLHTEEMAASDAAMNRWLETKLAKYIRNEMATPEDPLRALAERGVLHYDPTPTGYSVSGQRVAAGFPEEGMAQSDLAKRWEKRADTFFNELQASDLTKGYPEQIETNPWLLKVPPETRVYELLGGANEELGMQHLVDELKNAINPESGLPASLRLKYSDLEKVTVPQAVERVAKINEWRAANKAEADMARAMNPATQVVKEYPEQGFKWVELRKPETTGKNVARTKSAEEIEMAGEGVETMSHDDIVSMTRDMARDEGIRPGTQEFNDMLQENIRMFGVKPSEIDESVKSLEDALKYEGETMGHCVGRYCPDVIEGRSRIYSLRDKKGQPHVTIEVAPGSFENAWKMLTADEQAAVRKATGSFPSDEQLFEAMKLVVPEKAVIPEEIVQIKGKANRAPNPEYLPAVQDFVRSGNWSKVGDLQNTGLVDLQQMGVPDAMRGGQRFVTEDEYKDIVRKNAEGFAQGGLVGGANFPTYDFDPARIDSIVGELHAMNAG